MEMERKMSNKNNLGSTIDDSVELSFDLTSRYELTQQTEATNI